MVELILSLYTAQLKWRKNEKEAKCFQQMFIFLHDAKLSSLYSAHLLNFSVLYLPFLKPKFQLFLYLTITIFKSKLSNF